MSTKKSMTVHVLGQEFSISTDASPERVKKIEDFVNQTIALMDQKSKTTVPYTLVVLAALNIAEKYLDAIESKNKIQSHVVQKSKKILELLEN